MGWTLTKLEGGELRLAVGTVGGSFTVDSQGARLTPEVWHHVAARRLGGTFTLFVNGRAGGELRRPVGELAGPARAVQAVTGADLWVDPDGDGWGTVWQRA